ncbi:MAG: NAD-dependent epimerase/dehydratase family protein [Aquificota bacterium]|nr:MAG: NAD-dependent epimerase/dehydratase family protein [Aquificota bacterium]
MRVLLTGATGFVGRHTVKELLKEGYEVGCIVRSSAKLKEVFPGESIKAFEVSLEDKRALLKTFEDFAPQYLIHLVGILVEDRKRGQTFMKVHYLYSKNLYEVAKTYGGIQKVVHMSSLGTHPDAPSMYHRTKLMAEEELKRSGLKYTIIRPSIILGPEQRLFFDMWSITKLLPLVALPGGGGYLFQPVDVRDVACAFVKALKDQESNFKTYELCGDKRVSFKELLEDIFSYWKRKVLLVPVPKALMYLGGLMVERLIQPPPFSSDQMLMMWKDNVCGLDPQVESQGVKKLCGKDPVSYEESLRWSLEGFSKLLS